MSEPTIGHDPELGPARCAGPLEEFIVAPLAEKMARIPTWKDATVRIQVLSEPGAADLTVP